MSYFITKKTIKVIQFFMDRLFLHFVSINFLDWKRRSEVYFASTTTNVSWQSDFASLDSLVSLILFKNLHPVRFNLCLLNCLSLDSNSF